MKHRIVYKEDGVYAGWPANHGAWQWGDEFLVGFIRGKYQSGGMHNVIGRLEKVQARSLDGGETWKVEVPNVDFEAQTTTDPPKFSLNSYIIRVCGNYDHGGEHCNQAGGFYLSKDKGHTWSGAYSFGLHMFAGDFHNTSRTCVHNGLVYLSVAKTTDWGSDVTFCARHDGERFYGSKLVIGGTDNARAVMPAVASLGGKILCLVRRRKGGECWIAGTISEDGGETWAWSEPFYVADTGDNNGNPPALIASGDRFYCAFANRERKTLEVRSSPDGKIWSNEGTRKGDNQDIGYPRLFKRKDGKIVCVYYWAKDEEEQQHIVATIVG